MDYKKIEFSSFFLSPCFSLIFKEEKKNLSHNFSILHFFGGGDQTPPPPDFFSLCKILIFLSVVCSVI